MGDERNSNEKTHFTELAKEARPGLVREFTVFLLTNKKWWLTPVILLVLLLGLVVSFGGTAAAPFIYTLF